jgi:2-amino-4-hydroxy-6-hydroxymethyldihydropteridine diphosphokinase
MAPANGRRHPTQDHKEISVSEADGKHSGGAPILIGIGANLPHPIHGEPRLTCEAAIVTLAGGLRILARSPWYASAPVPVSDQPEFVNGVISVATVLGPTALLALLHGVEVQFGRVRGQPNAARTLDLDLLAFGDVVLDDPGGLVVPHPRLHERAFVLFPLRDVAPAWRHPVTGATTAQLIAALPPGQSCRRLN